MTDSIAIGADGQANHLLERLRATATEGALASDVHFLPGLDLHADPLLGLGGTWRSPRGRLLELDARAAAPGGWCALHLALPLATTRGKRVLGFAARLAAREILVARACLRSSIEGGFVDCFFDKHLLFSAEEASHVDALHLELHEDIPQQAAWRELILFLPPQSFRLSLIDWRVFAV
ncbi:hypothetical protein [Salipiger aestuarii]|uniref:hypothetical protein n=1 Tax=Salipiger aestuarii TaxID=568098 RepID=UPI0012391CF0|nr:hypothetical protein [Salipiger aestuarii]KAA8610014.1 hypothetical protein AL037_14250 [Salipiger aestuarii]